MLINYYIILYYIIFLLINDFNLKISKMTFKKRQNPSFEDNSPSLTHTETKDVENEQSDNEINQIKLLFNK